MTPNCTLTGPPDVIPRQALCSPASDEYATPDSTLLENGHEHSFAMPTYFDHKRRTAAAALSAAVQPLTNFHIFKQKSLNTIPALLEKHKKNEELFTNFPFLTPLAHRKSSLVSQANRLSGCLEDELYYIPSEAEEGEARRLAASAERVSTSTPRAAAPSLRHSYTDRTRYAALTAH